MLGHFGEGRKIETGVPLGALEGGHQGFGGGLGGAVAEGAQARVHDVHAGLGGHKVGHVAGAGGVVGVQVDGDVPQLRLHLLHQAVGVVGQQQVRHVLDADGVGAHLDQLLRELHEVILAVDRGDGVAQRRLAPAAVLLGVLDGGLQVAGVVQSVEDADDVDAVLDGLAAEGFHHVVGVVLVAQDVLAAEEHLQLRLGQGLAELTEPLPGILVQVPEAGVEGGAAPDLQGPEADVVQGFAGGEHVGKRHPGGRLALVAVPQDGIGDTEFVCHYLRLPHLNRDRNTPAAMAEPMTPATLGPMACMSRKLPGLAF